MTTARSTRELKELQAAAKAEKLLRADRDRCEASLIAFLQGGWRYIDPQPYVPGWHLEAVAEHLEAVAGGQIRKLLINVPPRTSKSSLVSVSFPAWVWAQSEVDTLAGPHVQFLFASYAQSLSIRDSVKCRRLMESPWYQRRWGDRFVLTGDQNTKMRFENDQGGYRLATSVGGALTGEGAAIIVCDDVHNSIEAESEAIRETVLHWWDESLSTRLNDPKTGAYIVVMQRLNEDDLAGHIISKSSGDWCHLMLPMEYDPGRHCITSIGWSDPRREDGELLCPERFGAAEVKELKTRLGPFAASGQLQQSPEPRGGGIIKRAWWGAYELAIKAKPRHVPEFVVASLDPAFTSKQENDPSGFVICGVYHEEMTGQPRVLLMHAWKKWLELHGETQDRLVGEKTQDYLLRTRPGWGLVEQVAHDCTRLRVKLLLIEDKASGHSVAQEIRRLYMGNGWGVQLVNPGSLDKRARAYAIQHLFADGVIEAPYDEKSGMFREWAQMVIDESAKFRGLPGDEDNLVDALTQALKYLRDQNYIIRREERERDEHEASQHKLKRGPLYPA